MKKDLGGGAISELSHELDFANYLFKVKEVKSVQSFLDPWKKEVDGQSLVITEGRNAFGSIYLDIVNPELRRSINCFSENISISLDLINGTLEGVVNGSKLEEYFSYNRNDILKESLINFIKFNCDETYNNVPLNSLNKCLETSKLVSTAYSMLSK